jgi:hypothetical protein
VTVTAFKRYQTFTPLWSHPGFSTILGYTDHFPEIELEYSVLYPRTSAILSPYPSDPFRREKVGFWGVHRIGPQARGPSPEQDPINEFLVHKREIVSQHKLRVHVIHAPKVRFDSNETARLATTTRTLPIPESGPSISNQTLLIRRKTVHNRTTIIEVVATYEHTGAGPMSARSL